MKSDPNHVPNPKRVAAGKLNWLKRKGVTDAGREKQRRVALEHEPWKHSTGPRSPKGKAQSVINGKVRQKGNLSTSERQDKVAEVNKLAKEMKSTRDLLRDIMKDAMTPLNIPDEPTDHHIL